MLPAKFRVNRPFGSEEEEKKKIFKMAGPSGHLGSPIDRSLANFDLQVTLTLPTIESTGVLFRKRSENMFSDGRHCGHFGFQIETILSPFDLQVTTMQPTKYPVSWPFGSGEEVKNRFSRWASLDFRSVQFSYF